MAVSRANGLESIMRTQEPWTLAVANPRAAVRGQSQLWLYQWSGSARFRTLAMDMRRRGTLAKDADTPVLAWRHGQAYFGVLPGRA